MQGNITHHSPTKALFYFEAFFLQTDNENKKFKKKFKSTSLYKILDEISHDNVEILSCY